MFVNSLAFPRSGGGLSICRVRDTLFGIMARSFKDPKTDRGFLDGQLLIAMPGMQDTRFARTVVYICAHSADGAMGITIN
jgi:putative transcriptional regulator